MIPINSTIPSILALSKFFTQNFPHIWWYPNWYLGVPYNYLIGPVVPVLVGRVGGFGLLGIWGVSWVIGGIGVYRLVRELNKVCHFVVGTRREELGKQVEDERWRGVWAAALFLFLPFYFLLFLNGANGLYHFAWGFVPWIFVTFLKFLSEKGQKFALLLTLLITFVLLIDVSILLPVLVGFVCLGMAFRERRERGEIRMIGGEKFFRAGLVLALALSIATIWYGFGFWLNLLRNPSFGGLSLVNLIKFLFNLLLNLIPILGAVWVVRVGRYRPKPVTLFGLLFTFSFLFLTLIRFISDPDFVMDWIGFLIEIQFGIAIVIGGRLGRIGGFGILGGLGVILVLIVKTWLGGVNGQYQERISDLLREIPKSERVFLSGSDVFWANNVLDLNQVRGGVDQASVHPTWAEGAYQIREDESGELTLDWLKALGASWVLVHGQGSEEPYRDFKNQGKFRGIGEIREIGKIRGDLIYKVDGGSIARVADKQILQVKKPKDGVDKEALAKYVAALKTPISLTRPGLARLIELEADTKADEVISLAVSYDPGWREIGPPASLREALRAGEIRGDNFGNMVVVPEHPGHQKFVLEYSRDPREPIIALLISLALLLLILNYDKLYPKMSGMMAKLGHGLGEE